MDKTCINHSGKLLKSDEDSRKVLISQNSLKVEKEQLHFNPGTLFSTMNKFQAIDKLNETIKTEHANQSSEVHTLMDVAGNTA
jgi:hypothetical protein